MVCVHQGCEDEIVHGQTLATACALTRFQVIRPACVERSFLSAMQALDFPHIVVVRDSVVPGQNIVRHPIAIEHLGVDGSNQIVVVLHCTPPVSIRARGWILPRGPADNQYSWKASFVDSRRVGRPENLGRQDLACLRQRSAHTAASTRERRLSFFSRCLTWTFTVPSAIFMSRAINLLLLPPAKWSRIRLSCSVRPASARLVGRLFSRSEATSNWVRRSLMVILPCAASTSFCISSSGSMSFSR